MFEWLKPCERVALSPGHKKYNFHRYLAVNEWKPSSFLIYLWTLSLRKCVPKLFAIENVYFPPSISEFSWHVRSEQGRMWFTKFSFSTKFINLFDDICVSGAARIGSGQSDCVCNGFSCKSSVFLQHFAWIIFNRLGRCFVEFFFIWLCRCLRIQAKMNAKWQ